MTALAKLEARLAALEEEVAQLRTKVNGGDKPWWEKITGVFKDDPAFDEAMRLGKQWRDSFKPKPRKRKKVANGRARHRSH